LLFFGDNIFLLILLTLNELIIVLVSFGFLGSFGFLVSLGFLGSFG